MTIYSMFVIAIFLRMFHDTREAGRIILATDLFVLYFRLLEALTIFSSLGPKVLMIFKMVSNIYQCCQRRGLPAELGYSEIACRGSKYCWVGGLKLGYSFIGLLATALFSSNLPVSYQLREFLSLFDEHFSKNILFTAISGIKTSWRAINNNICHPLHVEVNNLTFFCPIE